MKSKESDLNRQNRNIVIRQIRKALREFGAEQAIIIMGKDEIVAPESGIIKHLYPMRIVEILNDKVYGKFMQALGQEIVRLKVIRAKKNWLIPPK